MSGVLQALARFLTAVRILTWYVTPSSTNIHVTDPWCVLTDPIPHLVPAQEGSDRRNQTASPLVIDGQNALPQTAKLLSLRRPDGNNDTARPT